MGLLDNIQLQNSQSNPIDVLKELINDDNIEIKTDVNIKQIQTLVRIQFYALISNPKIREEMTQTEILQAITLYYLKLMISKDRESRKEIIKAVSDIKDFLLQSPIQQPPK